MPEPFFEQHETNLGREPMIRLRFESQDTLEYELTQQSFIQWPNFLYHALAQALYTDADLWWVIADANPIRRANDWSVGDVILIPKDYRAALTLNQDEAALRRKLY